MLTGHYMVFKKIVYSLILFFCGATSAPLSANAELTTLYQTVEQALNYSPRLQAQTYNADAFKYKLRQSRGRYLPSVDLLLGYGLEQHSDSTTRQNDADPADTDWHNRGDFTVRLTQRIYDGGEASHQISLQKALLDSAHFHIQQTAQTITQNAIAAHLNVYKQRELVALAKKVLKVHQDIYQSLVEMEHAGAGCLADVTQTQARMARARSNVFISKADLDRAIANYEQVVGAKPGELANAEIPDSLPKSLAEALRWTEQGNPELQALNARIIEAHERVGLARSTYKPKINIELSNRYNDQLEGDPSWQNTSDAMLNMRWNLYNGGQDKAEENAALARKHQSRSERDAKLFELREATTSAWTTYLYLQKQKVSYREAVDSSEKTIDAYLKQFSFSQRSLLDVLNTVTDYFQYARQLVTVSVDEVMAAYRILEFGGRLQPTKDTAFREYPEDFKRLSKAILSPPVAQSPHPESHVPLAR